MFWIGNADLQLAEVSMETSAGDGMALGGAGDVGALTDAAGGRGVRARRIRELSRWNCIDVL